MNKNTQRFKFPKKHLCGKQTGSAYFNTNTASECHAPEKLPRIPLVLLEFSLKERMPKRRRCKGSSKFVDESAVEEGKSGESSEDEDGDSSEIDIVLINNEKEKGYHGPMFIPTEEDLVFERTLEALQSGKPIPRAPPRRAAGVVVSDTEEETPASQPASQPVRRPVKGAGRLDVSLKQFISGAKDPSPAALEPVPPPPVAPLFLGPRQVKDLQFTGKKGITQKKTTAPPPRPKLPGVYFRKDGSSYRVDENGDEHDGPDV